MATAMFFLTVFVLIFVLVFMLMFTGQAFLPRRMGLGDRDIPHLMGNIRRKLPRFDHLVPPLNLIGKLIHSWLQG
jgi:hypothetical protein